jgi:phosphate transport system ATP-binding protein
MNESIIKAKDLNLFYSDFQALYSVSLEIPKNQITALIGPSGCGKSTFLRCLNRMNDLYEGVSITGNIFVDNENILLKSTDLIKLRKKVGMVFQRPNPFPLSVFENVAYGLRVHHMVKGEELESIVERVLKAVLLWDDLKDKLKQNATTLTLEQQQKLCIARLLAVKPEIF